MLVCGCCAVGATLGAVTVNGAGVGAGVGVGVTEGVGDGVAFGVTEARGLGDGLERTTATAGAGRRDNQTYPAPAAPIANTPTTTTAIQACRRGVSGA